MAEIRDTLIRAHLTSLRSSIGATHPAVDEALLHQLHGRKEYTEMFGVITQQMGLTNRIFVGYVRNNAGPKKAPAWTLLRTPVPLFGTQEFRDYSVTTYIRNQFLKDAPFETVVYTIVHELAHILLASLQSPLWGVEEAVDLAVLLLGYGKFYAAGKEYTTAAQDKKRAPDAGSPFADLKKPFEDLLEKFGVTQKSGVPNTTYTIGYLTADEISYAEKLIANYRKGSAQAQS